MYAGISNTMRKGVYKRDGYRCALCDSTSGLQVHHIMPRGQGGADHPMNLITLCWRCHAAAHGSIMGDTTLPAEERKQIALDVELAAVQYVADYYAERGEEWYPWDG